MFGKKGGDEGGDGAASSAHQTQGPKGTLEITLHQARGLVPPKDTKVSSCHLFLSLANLFILCVCVSVCLCMSLYDCVSLDLLVIIRTCAARTRVHASDSSFFCVTYPPSPSPSPYVYIPPTLFFPPLEYTTIQYKAFFKGFIGGMDDPYVKVQVEGDTVYRTKVRTKLTFLWDLGVLFFFGGGEI